MFQTDSSNIEKVRFFISFETISPKIKSFESVWKKSVQEQLMIINISTFQHKNNTHNIHTLIYTIIVIIVSRCNVYRFEKVKMKMRERKKKKNPKIENQPRCQIWLGTHTYTHTLTPSTVVFIYTTFSPMYPITNFFFFSLIYIFFFVFCNIFLLFF